MRTARAAAVGIGLAALLLGAVTCARDEAVDGGANVKEMDVTRPEPERWSESEEKVARDLREWSSGKADRIDYRELREPDVRAESVWNLDRYFEPRFDKDNFIQLRPDDAPVRVGAYRYLYRYPYVYQIDENDRLVSFRVIGVKEANELVVEDLAATKLLSDRNAARGDVPTQR